MKKGDYLHTSPDEIEGERLRLFNLAYGPTTRRVLQPYVQPTSKILELGIGTGDTARWLVQQLGSSGSYTGVDKDARQLERTRENIGQVGRVNLVQADVLQLDTALTLSKAKPADGFDLIYCRWLLCHILNDQRVALIKQIISLLAVGGVFICEEPDYHPMHLRIKGQPTENTSIQAWKDLVPVLQENLGLNLELDADHIQQECESATQITPGNFKVELLESFTAELQGEEKLGLPLGMRTAKASLLFFTGKAEQELDHLTAELEKIAEDPDATVVFYTNTFIKITRLA